MIGDENYDRKNPKVLTSYLRDIPNRKSEGMKKRKKIVFS